MPSNRKNLPAQQLSNSANDNLDKSYRKQLLKRYGESESPNSDWPISHPTTQEELRDMMKYDPYYAQYYYSKYRPQDEGRHVEDQGEDYISIERRRRPAFVELHTHWIITNLLQPSEAPEVPICSYY